MPTMTDEGTMPLIGPETVSGGTGGNDIAAVLAAVKQFGSLLGGGSSAGLFGIPTVATAIGSAANQIGLAKQRNDSRKGINEAYDSNARTAYINYLKQQNSMNESMRNNGITGGASETARVNAANNYSRNRAINDASRNAAMTSLDNSYRDATLQNLGNLISGGTSLFNNAIQQSFQEKQFEAQLAQAAQENAWNQAAMLGSTLVAKDRVSYNNMIKGLENDIANGVYSPEIGAYLLGIANTNKSNYIQGLKDTVSQMRASGIKNNDPALDWYFKELQWNKYKVNK